MAWRIHEHVVRGEIDNRERGIVRGRIWLHGQAEPVVLDLKGNAHPDLAGCLLTFENPGNTFPMPSDGHLALLQRGTIGDLTASRKVRVFDIPVAEACALLKKKQPVPEHIANCLYLEWFSEANGRVVVESADYKLTLSPPAWRLTPEEEQERQEQAAAGFSSFMQKLSQALEQQKHQPPPDKEWDEFDYEKLMRECDARTDKYGELLDKYLDHPDRDRIIAREMGWTRLEEAPEAEEEAENDPSKPSAASGEEACDISRDEPEAREDSNLPCEIPDEVPPLEPDPATEGVDWVRCRDGFICHPLVKRAMDGGIALWDKYEEHGLDKTEHEALTVLLSEYQIVGAKLAGALDSLAYGRDVHEGPFIVACLKRALQHLHAAQAALEKVAAANLLPAEVAACTRAELFSLREETLKLMKEFRGRR